MSASPGDSPALIAARLEVAAAKRRLLEWAEVEDTRHLAQERSAFRKRLHEGAWLALEIGLQHWGAREQKHPGRWAWIARMASLVLRAIRRR